MTPELILLSEICDSLQNIGYDVSFDNDHKSGELFICWKNKDGSLVDYVISSKDIKLSKHII